MPLHITGSPVTVEPAVPAVRSATIAAGNLTPAALSGLVPFKNIAVQIDGTFTGNVRFEVSNDNITWQPAELARSDTSAGASQTAVARLYWGGCYALYFRVIGVGVSTGSAAVVIVFMP